MGKGVEAGRVHAPREDATDAPDQQPQAAIDRPLADGRPAETLAKPLDVYGFRLAGHARGLYSRPVCVQPPLTAEHPRTLERSGLPIAIAVVAWTLTIYAGHRIWRAGHPAANVWRELGRRGQAVAGFIAALVALLAIQAFPQVVAAIVGLWLAAIVLLFVALAIGSRGTKQ